MHCPSSYYSNHGIHGLALEVDGRREIDRLLMLWFSASCKSEILVEMDSQHGTKDYQYRKSCAKFTTAKMAIVRHSFY